MQSRNKFGHISSRQKDQSSSQINKIIYCTFSLPCHLHSHRCKNTPCSSKDSRSARRICIRRSWHAFFVKRCAFRCFLAASVLAREGYISESQNRIFKCLGRFLEVPWRHVVWTLTVIGGRKDLRRCAFISFSHTAGNKIFRRACFGQCLLRRPCYLFPLMDPVDFSYTRELMLALSYRITKCTQYTQSVQQTV